MQKTQPPTPPSKRNHSPSLLFQCSDLILPWLTPQELATVSLTCTALRAISTSITLRRAFDASRSLEPDPIPFHNSVDRHPYAFFYTPSQIPPSSSRFPLRQSGGSGCSARGPKWAGDVGVETVRLVDESGEAAAVCDCKTCGDEGGGCPCSEFGGFDGVVSECGLGCGCGLDCGNMVSQREIEVRLKIVRDRRKGWSLYADQFIPKGRFVCEYAGELLTTKEARLRQQVYDEFASGGNFSPALLVVREHLPSRKECLRYNIDATRVGNVARFINHLCDDGNVSTTLIRIQKFRCFAPTPLLFCFKRHTRRRGAYF